MTYKTEFTLASSDQIEAALTARLGQIRLAQNMTQKALAERAGVSLRTIARMEKGEGVSLDTFIRVLTALDLHASLEALLPDPAVRPVDRVRLGGAERKRARAKKRSHGEPWSWGDGHD